MGIIGSALGAAGSIFGGIMGAISARKQQQAVERQQRKNQEWYDRRYNEDATQRASAQRLLTRVQDGLRDANRAATGRAAVMGAADEGAAAAKAQNNKYLADTASSITAAADQRKDDIEAQYMQNDNAFVNQQNALEEQKQQNIASAVGGLMTTAGSLGI